MLHLKSFYIGLLLPVFIMACSQNKASNDNENARDISHIYPTQTEPKYDISFEKDLVIKASYDLSNNLHSIREIAVGENGYVYITVGRKIKVFDENGDFVTHLGRNGRGPGEFSNRGPLNPKIRKDKLYAYDDVLRKFNVYNLNTLTFSYSLPLRPNEWREILALKHSFFSGFYIGSDSLLIVEFSNNRFRVDKGKNLTSYYLMNGEGKIVSQKLFDYPYSTAYSGNGIPGPVFHIEEAHIPNASDRTTLVAFDSTGNIYSIWTEDIHISLFNYHSGEYDTISYPFKNRELNKADILEKFKSNLKSIAYERAQEMDYPETWPAVKQLIVDDQQRIWIATITDDENNFQWLVLNKKGALLAKFKWEGHRAESYEPNQIKVIKGNYLYTIEENEETDNKNVVRYRIELKPFLNSSIK